MHPLPPPPHPRFALVGAFLAVSLLPVGVYGSDWAQWRGPQRDGSAIQLRTGIDWSAAPEVVWSVAVGEGQSSPLVVGDKVLLFDRAAGEERVSAFSLESGLKLWSASDPVKFRPGMGGGHYGAGPKSTPVAQDGLVVTYGVRSLLTARHVGSGEIAWRHDLEDLGDATLYWGNSMSPIVFEGRVIVQYGNKGNGGVLAFDLRTGEQAWSIDGYGNSYASPVVVEAGGDTHVALMTYDGPVGVSADGEVLWQVKEPMSFSRQNTATPIVRERTLIFSSERRPFRTEKLEREGSGWRASALWARDDLSLDMASPVLFDGRVCGVVTAKRGQLVCLDAASGDEIFRGPAAQRRLCGAARQLQEHLLAFFPDEMVVLARDATAYEPLAEVEIASSETWATPAVLADGLVVKSFDRLERLSWPAP